MNKIIKITIATLIMISPVVLFAQPAPPPPPPPPVGIPIDGGLFLLLGSLAAYGAKKFLRD